MALAYVALVNREALVSRRLQVGDCKPSISDCEPSISACEPSIKVMPAMAQCPRLVSPKQISNIRHIPVTSNRCICLDHNFLSTVLYLFGLVCEGITTSTSSNMGQLKVINGGVNLCGDLCHHHHHHRANIGFLLRSDMA